MLKIGEAAPENPRRMFVVSASLFWTPQDRGGDREQALAMLERGVRLASAHPPSADTLTPSWGEAELHMLLAWFSLNLAPPDVPSARGHAEAALMLRPEWRYVRDNLLPQIRRRAGRAHLTTVAYRVHRMSAMLAFYREAFGIKFREVETGGGLRSRSTSRTSRSINWGSRFPTWTGLWRRRGGTAGESRTRLDARTAGYMPPSEIPMATRWSSTGL